MARTTKVDNSSPDISAASSQYSQLRRNRARLTKADISNIKSDLESNGKSSEKIDRLLANFDKIDINGDGVTADEFRTYTKSGLASGGLSKPNIQNSADDTEAAEVRKRASEELLAEAEAAAPSLLDFIGDRYNSDGSLSSPFNPATLLTSVKA